ncbi:hypothetical protein ASPWEDRAFT_549479 [Aspergillus wentii DTO 134E9]|uniref:Uncharacterized protein n=1 Tax=Aspergillus wentii DTO 134E9 TaxID=1073089 RepID=A0A1L9RG74_ASPWE|nr:uncharacterized protein ASPWEDRAFT_549479 [Aspergillus wentii DTO 134E9]OJJ33920.1 hypothetical protein ASPWEDRAFT_549479 [Aspergillus wentii DTO 134E9]
MQWRTLHLQQVISSKAVRTRHLIFYAVCKRSWAPSKHESMMHFQKQYGGTILISSLTNTSTGSYSLHELSRTPSKFSRGEVRVGSSVWTKRSDIPGLHRRMAKGGPRCLPGNHSSSPLMSEQLYNGWKILICLSALLVPLEGSSDYQKRSARVSYSVNSAGLNLPKNYPKAEYE